MITREALLHIPKSNYSYGFDSETLHIRVRLKKGEATSVQLRIGDPYIWASGGADGGNLNAAEASGWIGGSNIDMVKEAETVYYDYYSVFYKPEKKRSRYGFIIKDQDETILFGERKIVVLDDSNAYALNEMSNFYCFPYLNNIDVHTIPSWVQDTVWYQIFPDRFENGDPSLDVNVEPWGSKPTYDNFMGGDIQGIINRLDYLNDLGINGLYLCPIFKAGENHRYDTIDYMAIDELLGSKETFKKLVEEAHKRGIKIMIDAVFNHIGHRSVYWQDVVEHGENSKYKDWFHIHKFPVYDGPFESLDGNTLNYETFGRTKKMPKMNTENPEVIEYFNEVGRYWVEHFDVDAWRIDVANEVDHDFWRGFRKAIHEKRKDTFLLGEIWHDASPWLQGDQFDVAMNYPLTEAMIQYFCTHDIDMATFKQTVNQVKVNYSLQVTQNNFNLLDSHDTSRVFSIAGEDERFIKLAYIFMLTQPGSPCIYYGSEIPMAGVKGMMKEDHRSCMTFEHQDTPFYKFMKDLIHYRKSIRWSTDFEWLTYDDLLVYKNNNQMIFMNVNQDECSVTLDINGCDVFTKEVVKSRLTLEPFGYKIIEISN